MSTISASKWFFDIFKTCIWMQLIYLWTWMIELFTWNINAKFFISSSPHCKNINCFGKEGFVSCGERIKSQLKTLIGSVGSNIYILLSPGRTPSWITGLYSVSTPGGRASSCVSPTLCLRLWLLRCWPEEEYWETLSCCWPRQPSKALCIFLADLFIHLNDRLPRSL